MIVEVRNAPLSRIWCVTKSANTPYVSFQKSNRIPIVVSCQLLVVIGKGLKNNCYVNFIFRLNTKSIELYDVRRIARDIRRDTALLCPYKLIKV